MQIEKFSYDNKVVKWFAYATMIWGIVGFLAGLWIAISMWFPAINLNFFIKSIKITINP